MEALNQQRVYIGNNATAAIVSTTGPGSLSIN